MPTNKWEFRINGIRSSGDTFPSWEAANRRLFQALNHLHFETEGEERDFNGRLESFWTSQFLDARKLVPREPVRISAKRKGKPWFMTIDRIPW